MKPVKMWVVVERKPSAYMSEIFHYKRVALRYLQETFIYQAWRDYKVIPVIVRKVKE